MLNKKNIMQSKNLHHPERNSQRVDKMSNYYSGKDGFPPNKKLSNKKRRQLLRQNFEGKI